MRYTVTPVGFVRSPFGEKVAAPRQATAPGAEGVVARVEILPAFEHALSDIEGFERIWLLFWFDRLTERAADGGTGPTKVLPPRSDRKRGVFATRSPHRPNPIGMSAVRLDRVEGLVLFVRDLDLLDGTPVIDVKPYLPYADAFPEANAGWLDAKKDPVHDWLVELLPLAEEQLAFVMTGGGPDLRGRILETLALGPQPHPYRRIRPAGDGTSVLAIKEWRVVFTERERTLTVLRLTSGYRPRELHGTGEALALHRAFVARFG